MNLEKSSFPLSDGFQELALLSVSSLDLRWLKKPDLASKGG